MMSGISDSSGRFDFLARDPGNGAGEMPVALPIFG